MTEMTNCTFADSSPVTEKALREWIRRNVVIDVSPVAHDSNDVFIGLRFRSEVDPFVCEHLHIPRDVYREE
jgi:hypothetical protein